MHFVQAERSCDAITSGLLRRRKMTGSLVERPNRFVYRRIAYWVIGQHSNDCANQHAQELNLGL
jgi:hypothetical protein